MVTIGGTLVAHNCFEYDYCLEASLESLLGLCDEVVVCEADSSDNTRSFLEEKAKQEPKLRLIHREWKPTYMGTWLADLTNEARKELKTDFHFSLQADEVLSQDSFQTIRQRAKIHRELPSLYGDASSFKRLNFWKDHRHYAPPGRVCGTTVVRLAPVDRPSIQDAEQLHAVKATHAGIRALIFHYGFIRHTEPFLKKSIPMQTACTGGTYDPILDEIKENGENSALWGNEFPTCVEEKTLIDYYGSHPRYAHKWLKEHGYGI